MAVPESLSRAFLNVRVFSPFTHIGVATVFGNVSETAAW